MDAGDTAMVSSAPPFLREVAHAPPPPAAARSWRRRAAPGSVEALVAEYRRSRWWRKLAPKTQYEYGWALRAITDWAGDMPARGIIPPAVQAFYEAQLRRVEGKGRARKVIETPAKAAAAVRVLRLLLQVGIRIGYVASNAATDPGISLDQAREPVPWSAAEISHMAAVADAMGWRSMGTAILLNEWIGQRLGDVLALAPWRVEAEALRIRQSKIGQMVRLPVHLVPHLVARLKEEAAREGAVLSTEFMLLHEGAGKPWKLFTFSHVFAEVRAKAAERCPRVKPGVLIHVHDILLPWDYPDMFVPWYWSEAYILAAYFLGGLDRVKPVLPTAWICRGPQFEDWFATPLVDLGAANGGWRGGGTMWFTHTR
jgi:hypothetical protein